MGENPGKFALSGDVYDFLNNMVKLGFPALGALYFGLAKIWNFPYGGEIVGTLAVLAIFFGVVLTISRTSYNNKVQDAEYLQMAKDAEAYRELQAPRATSGVGQVPVQYAENIKYPEAFSQ